MPALADLADLPAEAFLPAPAFESLPRVADDPALVSLDDASEPPVAESAAGAAFVLAVVESLLSVADSVVVASATGAAPVVSAGVDSAAVAGAALVAPLAADALLTSRAVDRVTVFAALGTVAAALVAAVGFGTGAPMA